MVSGTLRMSHIAPVTSATWHLCPIGSCHQCHTCVRFVYAEHRHGELRVRRLKSNAAHWHGEPGVRRLKSNSQKTHVISSRGKRKDLIIGFENRRFSPVVWISPAISVRQSRKEIVRRREAYCEVGFLSSWMSSWMLDSSGHRKARRSTVVVTQVSMPTVSLLGSLTHDVYVIRSLESWQFGVDGKGICELTIYPAFTALILMTHSHPKLIVTICNSLRLDFSFSEKQS